MKPMTLAAAKGYEVYAPQMRLSKKGKQWHFGMKLHIGVDRRSALIHSASVTAGNRHDSQELSTSFANADAAARWPS